MQTFLSHIQVNVYPSNVPFYRELMACLGWRVIYDSEGMLGVLGKNGASVWFSGQAKAVSNDYDGPGMNHMGIGAQSQADVDAVTSFLVGKGVKLLFETPRHRPEFSRATDQTYYQVMFESPDRILWEVVYAGPKVV